MRSDVFDVVHLRLALVITLSERELATSVRHGVLSE